MYIAIVLAIIFITIIIDSYHIIVIIAQPYLIGFPKINKFCELYTVLVNYHNKLNNCYNLIMHMNTLYYTNNAMNTR